MKKMADTHHLVFRKNCWYYRRRVPTHLVGVLGKKFIQCSLGSPYKKIAIQKRELLDVEWSKKFAEAESAATKKIHFLFGGSAPETPGDSSGEPARRLTQALAVRLVQEYVEQQDHRRRAHWLALNSEEKQDPEIRDNFLEEYYIARERATNHDFGVLPGANTR